MLRGAVHFHLDTWEPACVTPWPWWLPRQSLFEDQSGAAAHCFISPFLEL